MAAFRAAFVVLAILACGIRWSQAVKAKPCDPSNCDLPDCRCSLTDIPKNQKKTDTPQIIMLTFDDAVSQRLYDLFYATLLSDEFKNPNGCPIGMTFFTSHEYCDYVLVHDLWSRGHEIASHSISHKSDMNYWKNGDAKMWYDELVGMRDILEEFARVPSKDVKGVRVPFLQIGGNTQFEVMQDNDFLWDCSMPTRTQVNPGMWPYSLDYKSKQQCQITPCPTDEFPGFWVVPMLDLMDKDENPCAMLDTCVVDYQNQTFDLLWNNFLRSYEGNRAPYGLFVHAAWFLNNEAHWDGYLEFIRKVITYKDVYFVTVSQALDFTRYPRKLDKINDWQNWKTQCKPKGKGCDPKYAHNCRLIKQEEWGPSERYMRICEEANCPNSYPWVGDPLGEKE